MNSEERPSPSAEDSSTSGSSQGNGAGEPSPASGPDSQNAPRPEDEGGELQRKLAFYVDQLQRSRAELENFRKRTQRERLDTERRLKVELFRQILPIIDDLEKALKSDEEGGNHQHLREGLKIILDKFMRLLEEFRIRPIEAQGQPFDPTWHEALFHEETDAAPEGVVLEEFERGYHLEEDLIRPARVKVAKAPSSGTRGTAGRGDEE